MPVSLIGHDEITIPSRVMYQAALAAPTAEAGGARFEGAFVDCH